MVNAMNRVVVEVVAERVQLRAVLQELRHAIIPVDGMHVFHHQKPVMV